MRKDKFIYNTQTLSYEKIVVTWQQRLLQVIEYSAAVAVMAVILVLLHNKFFPTSKEKALQYEIDQMDRMVFEMEPIDEYVWESGVGGSDKYEQLKNFRSKDIMTEAAAKVDKLGRQLAMQSKSLDDIRDMAEGKEEMLNSIPSIRPIGKPCIDFTAPRGTPIYATGNGKVRKVTKSRSGYGNRIVIDHGHNYKTLYAHMHTIDVKKGDKVKKGDIIGTVGSTGSSTAPHLHYEVMHKGKKINPIHFCLDGLSPQEYDEMLEMASVVNQSFDAEKGSKP